MISNSQYNAIMRIYDRLQSDNRYEREQRRLEVYGRIPRMRELNTAAGASALRRLQAVTGGKIKPSITAGGLNPLGRHRAYAGNSQQKFNGSRCHLQGKELQMAQSPVPFWIHQGVKIGAFL